MKKRHTVMPSSSAVCLLMGVTIACLVLLGDPVAAQEIRKLRGRVIDAEGEPMANVRVGTLWDFTKEVATPMWRADARSSTNPEVRSAADGRFTADLFFRGRPVAVYALHQLSKSGCIAIVDTENIDKELIVRMERLVQLRGTLDIKTSAFADNVVYIYGFDPRAPIALVRAMPKGEGEFSFYFPPGSYKFTFSAKDLQPVGREVALESDTGELDLGAIELTATTLAEHYGKSSPPWNVTQARGVSPGVKLSDYRGKWVLIEFWSYW